jgi:hypothetical protein
MPAAVKKSIVALRGDVTGSLAVDVGDVNAVKAVSGLIADPYTTTAIAFRRDITANGAVDVGDVNLAKSRSGISSFPGVCPTP